MTRDQFFNATRLLWNLDQHELVEAGVIDDHTGWHDFALNPHRWAAKVDDETMDKLWALMRKRSNSLDAAVADHEERVRMIPDDALDTCLTQNPIMQVYFRAGLLACREYMARFVEQGGDAATAQSIRANWWPSLGDDPGPPRRYSFDELAEEKEGPNGEYRVEAKPISPSIEALARAFVWLYSFGAAPAESEADADRTMTAQPENQNAGPS